jgi:hypothetical protein
MKAFSVQGKYYDDYLCIPTFYRRMLLGRA